MKKLTPVQGKMVIEYFGQQAAQDAPATTDWEVWDRHLWMTNHKVDLAIERRIKAGDWGVLTSAMSDLQSYDRDPAGYLNERGENGDSAGARDWMLDILTDVVSWAIDTAWNNSGA